MTKEEQQAADAAKAAADAKAKEAGELLAKLKDDYGMKLYSDEDMKTAIKERQEAKEALRKKEEDERKAAEAKLVEQGKKDELLKMKDAELEKERAERAKVLEENVKLAEKAKRLDEQEKSVRDGALAQLKDPEDRLIGESLPTSQLLSFVKKFTTERGAPYSGKGAPPEKDSNPLKRRPNESMVDWSQRVDREIGTRK